MIYLDSYYGGFFEGSSDLQTSVANTEILTSAVRYTDFQFLNDLACHVLINNGNPIYLRANQGFTASVINSLKVVESGISFNWIGVRL